MSKNNCSSDFWNMFDYSAKMQLKVGVSLFRCWYFDINFGVISVCDYSFADIFFVLDSSGSEGSVGFHHQLDFTKLVVNGFQVGVDDTHVGISKYSTGGNLEISLR